MCDVDGCMRHPITRLAIQLTGAVNDTYAFSHEIIINTCSLCARDLLLGERYRVRVQEIYVQKHDGRSITDWV